MSLKIKNLFLYGGISHEDYLKTRAKIRESNRINLVAFSAVAFVGMVVMLFGSLIDQSLVKNRLAYAVCVAICLILFGTAWKLAGKRPWLTFIGVYVFTALLFAFGIALGTVVEPNEVTVSFTVLLFAAPLLFTDRPIRMIIAILIGIAAYIWAAKLTQSSVMQAYNLSNILPYGLISMIVSTYLTMIKVRRYLLEFENKYLIESDQMTGLLNRRSYEEHIRRLRESRNGISVTVCAMDLNGLKSVNDHVGHQAGDDMIKGAAVCIHKVFSPYGACYRTGGDEFIAILERDDLDADDLKRKFQESCREFEHAQIRNLSISIGIVTAGPETDIDQLIREADQEMYRAKAEFYVGSGHDRRKNPR